MLGVAFVRRAGGASHDAAESASLADVSLGLEALHRVCLEMAEIVAP